MSVDILTIEDGGYINYDSNTVDYLSIKTGGIETLRLRNGSFGDSFLNSNFNPLTDDAYQLGNATYRWKNLFLSGQIYLPDKGTIRLGAGEDLLIHHNGTHSYITNYTGQLVLTDDSGSGVYIDARGPVMIRDRDDGFPILFELNTNTRELHIGASADIIATTHYGDILFPVEGGSSGYKSYELHFRSPSIKIYGDYLDYTNALIFKATDNNNYGDFYFYSEKTDVSDNFLACRYEGDAKKWIYYATIETQSSVTLNDTTTINGEIVIKNTASKPPDTTRVHLGLSSGALRTYTSSGYLDIGPRNTSWCHFITDRPSFYFNNAVVGDNDLGFYNGGSPRYMSDFVLFGYSNSAWVPCMFMGDEPSSNKYVRVESGNQTYQTTSTSDYSVWFLLPLPTLRGGWKLYLNGLRVIVTDADSNDYIDLVEIHGFNGTYRTLIYSSGTNRQIGSWDYGFGPYNLSNYDLVIIRMKLLITTLGDLNFLPPLVRVYYA